VGSGNVSKEFLMIQKFIEDICGIALREEKAFLLESKLSKILAESTFSSFDELYREICCWNDPKILESFIDIVTINETFWFRDKTPWNIMEDLLLPIYIQEIRDGKREKIRIWSAACSYGQEPYSIAMCIDNYLEENSIFDVKMNHFEILATDISKTVLQIAEVGAYDNISILRGLDEHYKLKYFTNQGRVWKLEEKIKKSVRFEQFNLIKDFSCLGKFDMIFFRNVMIYFSEQLKKEMLNKIMNLLNPRGALFIGSSELLIDHGSTFSLEKYTNGSYFKVKE